MIVVSGEAVRYGGRVASVGAWVPSEVLRASFSFCVRVCVCFFCIELLMGIYFVFELWISSIILSVFLFTVLNFG